MKAPRLKKLCWWFAGVYLGWSLLVYLGSLGSEAHSWWPIFLMPVIFPWSWVFEMFSKEFLYGWLAPDPKAASAHVWMVLDGIAGAFYIGFGTLWLWFVGKTISLVVTKIMPDRGAPNQTSVPMSPSGRHGTP